MPNENDQAPKEHRCLDGWVCERHPDQPWPHYLVQSDPEGVSYECAAAGMLCSLPEHAGVVPVSS